MSAVAPGDTEPDRCSARSLARDEPLLGTASRVRRWVLLEEPGPWGRTALRDSRLPLPVAALLRELAAHPEVKVLLVRRPGRTAAADAGPRALVVAGTERHGGWLRSARLAAVEDVLALRDELLAFVRDRVPPPATTSDDGGPLLLVCTHGRHDACCAELGRPLAGALAAVEPERTWEVSHVGGDRFAGNVVVLTDGFYLGRVPPAMAHDVTAALSAGQLPLPFFRGRSAYGVATQAAEVYVRHQLGATHVDDLRLVGHGVAGERTTAMFARQDGSRVIAVVRGSHAPEAWRLTCQADHDDHPHAFALMSLEQLPRR